MLENSEIKVRRNRNASKSKILFIVVTSGIILFLAVFFPQLMQLVFEKNLNAPELHFNIDFFYRSIIGLFSGIILALVMLKFIKAENIHNLIRFFLLTFILLAAMTYLAFRK